MPLNNIVFVSSVLAFIPYRFYSRVYREDLEAVRLSQTSFEYSLAFLVIVTKIKSDEVCSSTTRFMAFYLCSLQRCSSNIPWRS